MIMRRICIILINELAKVQASRLSEQFKIAGEAENNSSLGFAACLSKNSKIKIPNSSAGPLKMIFAFLMLNTTSPAHNKIFGAKFLSFERLGYIINTQCVIQFSDEAL